MSAQTTEPGPNSGFYWIPIFGWMLRDLDAGHEDAPLWSMLVVAMLGGIAGVIFGLWAFLALFLLLTPIFLIGYAVSVFKIISGDMGRTHEEKIAMRERIAGNAQA